MGSLFIRVKGIVREDDKYLLLKRWVDDRIPDPFIWEFIEGEIQHGEAPDAAVLRLIQETLGVEGQVERILYTWSSMLEDTQCVGITYLCSLEEKEDNFVLPEDYGEWIWTCREDFERYIENRYVLQDLADIEL